MEVRAAQVHVPFGRALFIGLVWAGLAWALRLPAEGSLSLPLWALAVPLVVALLVWGLLVARRYPAGGGVLVFGAPMLAVVVAIGVVFLTTPRPIAPAGVPGEVGDLPAAFESLPPAVDAAVVFRDPDGSTPLTVEFPAVETLDGHWAFSGAGVSSEAFGTAGAPSRPPDWGDTITTSGDDTEDVVTPTFQVDLPLTAELEHTTITATAGMSLRYPQGGFLFSNEEERLERQVQLFVGSPDDRAYRAALDSWREVDAFVQRYGLPLAAGQGGIGLLLTVVGLVRLVRAGR